MSQAIFNERIKRIERNGPSIACIPGQIGEPEKSQKRSIKRINRSAAAPRPKTAVTALLFGGILGAFAGLAFQNVVGAEALLTLDFRAELALAERDIVRGATWVAVAAGAILALLTFPSLKKKHKLAWSSFAYLATAVSVNAQDLIALMPASGG